MRVSVPCGCPWRPYPFKEPRGAMLHAYSAVGCNEPTSLQQYSVAALDFLTHNVWTTCLVLPQPYLYPYPYPYPYP